MAALLPRAGLPSRDLRVHDLGTAVRIQADADHVAAPAVLEVLASVPAEAGFPNLPDTVAAIRRGGLHDDATAPRHR